MRKLLFGLMVVAFLVPFSTGCGKKGTTGGTGGNGGDDKVAIKEVSSTDVEVKAGDKDGTKVTVTLKAKAKEAVTVEVSGLPDGVTASGGEIAKDATTGDVVLKADDAAKADEKEATFKVGESTTKVKVKVTAKPAPAGGTGGQAKINKMIKDQVTKATIGIKTLTDDQLPKLVKAIAKEADAKKKKVLETAKGNVIKMRDALQKLVNEPPTDEKQVKAYIQSLQQDLVALQTAAKKALEAK